MDLQVVRVDTVAPRPWDNRAGATRELLAWPLPAAWTLQVAVTEIRDDTSLQAHPGTERHFVVLGGEGVEMSFRRQVRKLRPSHGLLHFDGGQPPQCRLLFGEVRGLDVIHRHGSPALVARAWPRVAWALRSPLRALFAATEVELHGAGAAPVVLPPMSLAWALDAGDAPWHVVGPPDGYAWWIAHAGAGEL